KKNAAKIVQRHAVARVLSEYDLEMRGGLIVVSRGLHQRSIEEICSRQLWVERQPFPKNRAGAGNVAFLQGGASDVHPAIGILGIDLGDLFERSLRRFQIALQQQPDAVIVPALPV